MANSFSAKTLTFKGTDGQRLVNDLRDSYEPIETQAETARILKKTATSINGTAANIKFAEARPICPLADLVAVANCKYVIGVVQEATKKHRKAIEDLENKTFDSDSYNKTNPIPKEPEPVDGKAVPTSSEFIRAQALASELGNIKRRVIASAERQRSEVGAEIRDGLVITAEVVLPDNWDSDKESVIRCYNEAQHKVDELTSLYRSRLRSNYHSALVEYNSQCNKWNSDKSKAYDEWRLKLDNDVREAAAKPVYAEIDETLLEEVQGEWYLTTGLKKFKLSDYAISVKN